MDSYTHDLVKQQPGDDNLGGVLCTASSGKHC